MGNASGKEEIENSGENFTASTYGHPSHFGSGARLSPPVVAMGNSPPESPGRSRSPLMFAPQPPALFSPAFRPGDRNRKSANYVIYQGRIWRHYYTGFLICRQKVPVAPLPRPSDVPPVFSQYWMNDPYVVSDAPHEKEIPVLITWNYGGNGVLVEGSWDNWSSRKILQRTGKDHSILMVLPSGVYQYRFIVDGRWRYAPDLPSVANDMGDFNNIIDVNEYVPDDLHSVSEFESPPSPDSSYSRQLPVDEDFAKEPPAIPPHLHLTVLGTQKPEETFVRPQHVVLNHLFIEKGWSSQSLVPLGYTHRFQSKYVTVVLYKPAKR